MLHSECTRTRYFHSENWNYFLEKGQGLLPRPLSRGKGLRRRHLDLRTFGARHLPPLNLDTPLATVSVSVSLASDIWVQTHKKWRQCIIWWTHSYYRATCVARIIMCYGPVSVCLSRHKPMFCPNGWMDQTGIIGAATVHAVDVQRPPKVRTWLFDMPSFLAAPYNSTKCVISIPVSICRGCWIKCWYLSGYISRET